MHRRAFVLGMLTATASLAVTRTAVAQPVPGGAMPTPVYLNMATKGGLFLENTARDAFEKTTNPRVKTFSRAEVVEQVSLSRKLAPYSEGLASAAAGGPPGPGGLIGGLVAAPLAVAGGVAGAAVGVAGGALGGPPTGGMTTDEQKAQLLSQLAATQPGPQYDAAFVSASLQGHQEAYAIHGSYAESGEDPQLRRIAQGAIPLIRLHISQLTKMQAMMGRQRG